jgi:hypothetical protein
VWTVVIPQAALAIALEPCGQSSTNAESVHKTKPHHLSVLCDTSLIAESIIVVSCSACGCRTISCNLASTCLACMVFITHQYRQYCTELGTELKDSGS